MTQTITDTMLRDFAHVADMSNDLPTQAERDALLSGYGECRDQRWELPHRIAAAAALEDEDEYDAARVVARLHELVEWSRSR